MKFQVSSILIGLVIGIFGTLAYTDYIFNPKVNEAILPRFARIDEALIKTIRQDNATNENKLAGILSSSKQDPKVLAAKEKAKLVRELSDETVKYLDDVKARIMTEPDGSVIEGENLITNTKRAEELMLDSDKPEEGISFEKKLTSYVYELNKIMGLQRPFPKLTKKAEDFEVFKDNTNQLDKTFLQFTFEGTPTIAAIATISQLQTEVLEYESVALDSLNSVAEGQIVQAGKVVPMVRAESNTLVAGQEYNADLFIAAASDLPAENFLMIDPWKLPGILFQGLTWVRLNSELQVAPMTRMVLRMPLSM